MQHPSQLRLQETRPFRAYASLQDRGYRFLQAASRGTLGCIAPPSDIPLEQTGADLDLLPEAWVGQDIQNKPYTMM